MDPLEWITNSVLLSVRGLQLTRASPCCAAFGLMSHLSFQKPQNNLAAAGSQGFSSIMLQKPSSAAKKKMPAWHFFRYEQK